MTYAVEHASAYADLAAAGESWTFARTRVAYVPATGVQTPSTTTITAKAIRRRDFPRGYIAPTLTQQETLSLLICGAAYGDTPLPGDTATSGNGTVYTVDFVTPVAPDGTTIVARVVVSR